MKVLNTILILIFAALIALLLLNKCDKPKDEENDTYEAQIIVVDADTDEPIEGAKVKIKSNDDLCGNITLTTDEDGSCTFEYSDPDAVISIVRASKSGYEDGEVEDYEMSNFEDEPLVIPLKKKDFTERADDIGGEGALKITLMWEDSTVDLDLHVLEPNGFEIYYMGGREPEGHMYDEATGGELDVDWTPTMENRPSIIGENAKWANPPRGTYKVWVYCYNPEEAPPTDCTVVVKRENMPDEEYHLTLNGQSDEQHIPDIIIR